MGLFRLLFHNLDIFQIFSKQTKFWILLQHKLLKFFLNALSLLFCNLYRFIYSTGNECHASSPRKILERTGMHHLSGSTKERHWSFLLLGTSPDLSGMLQTQFRVLPTVQTRLQRNSASEESFGWKNDFTTLLRKFLVFKH